MAIPRFAPGSIDAPLFQRNLIIQFIRLMKPHLLSFISTRPTAALLLALAISASVAHANHPVIVEGNNVSNGGPNAPATGATIGGGNGGDADGDAVVGAAEDVDNGTDRVFGTITGALGMANAGANQNGRVTVVRSGRFNEQVNITAANGNVTIEAAPGVEANIDAVLSGDVVGTNDTRQDQPGIIVNAPANRVVTLRNLVIRNWSEGIRIVGAARVNIDNCRIENNRDYGIRVMGTARVTITNSQVNGTGFRVGSLGDTTLATPTDPADPGNGIEFEDASRGLVSDTVITTSSGVGFVGNPRRVLRRNVVLFDNGRNFAPR